MDEDNEVKGCNYGWCIGIIAIVGFFIILVIVVGSDWFLANNGISAQKRDTYFDILNCLNSSSTCYNQLNMSSQGFQLDQPLSTCPSYLGCVINQFNPCNCTQMNQQLQNLTAVFVLVVNAINKYNSSILSGIPVSQYVN